MRTVAKPTAIQQKYDTPFSRRSTLEGLRTTEYLKHYLRNLGLPGGLSNFFSARSGGGVTPWVMTRLSCTTIQTTALTCRHLLNCATVPRGSIWARYRTAQSTVVLQAQCILLHYRLPCGACILTHHKYCLLDFLQIFGWKTKLHRPVDEHCRLIISCWSAAGREIGCSKLTLCSVGNNQEWGDVLDHTEPCTQHSGMVGQGIEPSSELFGMVRRGVQINYSPILM